jgi:hypothetical protein
MALRAVPAVPARRSTRRRGILVGAVLVLGSFVLAAPAASAASTSVPIDEVAAALLSSPVYVEPGNEAGVTDAEGQQLLSDVQSAGTPLYLAVLTKASLGSQTIADYTHSLGSKVGVKGTYAVIAGRQFYADSRTFDVSTLANESLAQNKAEGATAILTAFVAGVTGLASSGGSGDGTGPGTDPGTVPGFDPGTGGVTDTGGGSAVPFLIFGGVVAAGAVGIGVVASRASRKRTAEQLAAVRTVVDEDVTEFGEEATAVDATDARLGDAGRAELTAALSAYDNAKVRADAMRSPQEASLVTQALEDGRYYLACVNARINGTTPPVRRAPCFMDPRHGPSVQDVMWSPDGGAPRSVPVCQACAVELAEGRTPVAREVPSGPGGARVPYWMAGPQYQPYAGGYYNAYGNILPALMIGTMLGGGHTTVVNNIDNSSSGGWMGGGGDSGGGGWMGGGGGGFGGGGDFGGGGGGGDSGGGGGF